MNVMKKIKNQRRGINIAPMVDMMFLLLIFFMYSSVIVQREKKMTIEVPSAKSVDQSAIRVNKELIINIDKNNEITIGQGRSMTEVELKSLLLRIYDENIKQHIIIRADAQTKHEQVMKVMDVCRQAKITHISFAALPQKE